MFSFKNRYICRNLRAKPKNRKETKKLIIPCRERIGEDAEVHKQSGQMQDNGNEGAASSLKTSDIEIEMVETYNLLSYEQEDDENEDTVPSLKTSEFVLAFQGQTSAFKIQSDIFEQESEDLVRDVKKQETTEDDAEVHQETEHTQGNEKEEATSSLKTSDLENEMVVTDKGLSPEEDGENKPADDDDAEEWFLCRTDSDPETDDLFVEC